jgi:hypothetical protein
MPLNTSEGKGMLKQLFSEQNTKNAGINLAAAYMRCPEDMLNSLPDRSFSPVCFPNLVLANARGGVRVRVGSRLLTVSAYPL